MKNSQDTVVYVAKAAFKFGRLGLEIVQNHFQNVIPIFFDDHIQGEEGKQRVRNILKTQNYDYLISFWSELYIKDEELKKAKKGAINIHPAPPEHPGLGMFSYLRLFPHLRSHHGVTLHEMDAKFDHGTIYQTKRFDVKNLSDVELVTHTGQLTVELLEQTCQALSTGKPTYELQDGNEEKWADTFYTAALEQEWLRPLANDHPIRRLDCSNIESSIMYVECGAETNFSDVKNSSNNSF